MDQSITLAEIKQQLNQRSEFFCPAKWTELYLYLNHGNSNSCHHPIPHAIPEDLLSDPFVLHNTPHKLQQQMLMVQGERPSECHMCWHIEDAAPDAVSDRMGKSRQWQSHIKTLQVDPKFVPRLIEVVFDNICNLACSYCDSGQSSKWASHISKDPIHLESDYRELYRTIHIKPGSTKSAYMEAWLKWWPMIRQDVEVLRVSGGEPLISPNFWKFFDVLGDCPQLKFGINSNLSVPQHRLEDFAQHAHQFHSVRLSASIDAQHDLARYARRGLDFERFLSNCTYWCSETPDNCVLSLQSTVNIVSVWGFVDFLDLVKTLRQRYPQRVASFYTTVVRFPEFQCIALLPEDLRHQLAQDIQTALNKDHAWFDNNEHVLAGKIITYLRSQPKPLKKFDPQVLKSDLRRFLTQYDTFDDLKYQDVLPAGFADWLHRDR